MATPEDLPDRLRAGLGGLARADLDALVTEARAEARAEVKALLRQAYSQALLEQVGDLLSDDAPTRPATPVSAPARAERDEAEEGEGWWVYCVVPADRELPEGLTGVSERGEPRLIPAGGLAALAGPVPLADFGEAALKQNLNDLAWLERTVRAHESVLDAMLPGGALVPMRVCTIYRGEQQVVAMLEDGAPLFRDTLRELDGKAEWGVKILADRERLEAHVRSQGEAARRLDEDAAAKSEGGAYLARKQLAALVRDQIDSLLTEVVRETHARLEEWASASVTLPAQNKELSGHAGEMVFNGAYLVEQDRAGAFADLLGELEAQYAPVGLGFVLTGPWPAYNFAGAGASAEVRR